MATRQQVKTTYEVARTVEPIYTGGEVSADASGLLVATTVDEDVLIVDTQSTKSICRIDGDDEAVTSLCLAPDSSHVVICSRSLNVRIFKLGVDLEASTATATLLRSFRAHTTPIVSTAIDSTGSLLATGTADGLIKVWDLKGAFVTHNFHAFSGVVSALTFLKFEKTERKTKSISKTFALAAGGDEGNIKLWDLSGGKQIVSLDAHASVVRSLAFSEQEHFLLSASRDKTIITWDPSTWTARKTIPVLEVVEVAGLIHDGLFFFGAGENGSLRIWHSSSGKELTPKQSAGLETDAIVAAVSSPSEIITFHQDQTMKCHSLQGLRTSQADPLSNPLPVSRRKTANLDEVIDMACIGPNRSLMALAINTESVKLISIDAKTAGPESTFGNDVGVLEGHKDIIICLDTDWSGNWLATGAKDNTARLWRLDSDSNSYSCAAVFEGHAESIGAVALPKSPPTGSAARTPLDHFPAFLLTGSQDKTIKRWDTSKLKLSPNGALQSGIRAAYTRVAHEKDINAIDASPTAPLFASASQDRTIKIWSVEDGSVTGILRGHKRGVWSIKFSPAGTPALALADGGSSSSRGLLVSGSGDKTVKVWSLSTYTCLLTFEGHSNSVLKVIWLPPTPQTPDDTDEATTQRNPQSKQPLIASASADTLVKLWSPYAAADSDHLLTTLDNHTDRVWALASPTAPSPLTSTSPFPSSNPPQPYSLITGSADATLTFWADTTATTTLTATRAATARLEQDQLLQNHIHAKNYREAITLSLALNHPARLLRVLSDVVSLPSSARDADSQTGLRAVDDVLGSLDDEQVFKLLERVRDWNTNARTAVVAQRVLGVVLRAYGMEFFVGMARDRRFKGRDVAGLLRALEVYTERQYRRLEELVDESYLLEYTLREIDEVGGVVGNGDVVMAQ
jgi:U3 small nucleolar RNA-associated protein 13